MAHPKFNMVAKIAFQMVLKIAAVTFLPSLPAAAERDEGNFPEVDFFIQA